MSQRSNTIKAAGLYTFLSELQAPEGSLVKADNINIDEMGVITPRRGFGDYGEELPNTSQTVKQLLEYKNRILRHYNGKLEFDDGNGVFTPFLETIEEVEPGLRIKSKQVNSNLYFTTSDGIKKLSAKTSADLSNINVDNAGVPKAVDLTAKVSPASTGLGFLPPRSKVGYKILYGYRDLNNVLILGAPTSITVVINSEKESVIPEQFNISFQDGFTGSDFIDGLNNMSGGSGGTGKYFTLSTKDIDYYVWYSISDLVDGLETENPENSETFGKIAIQVSIKESDTHDKIAAKTANVLNSELSSQYEVTFIESTITLKSKEKGDIVDARIGNLASNEIIIQNINQGDLILGRQVNCEISTIIPKNIDKNKLPYFIQIYRTKFITATEDQELSDISPGEECNLVHEEAIQLEPGEIYNYIDDISENFRDRATPLYNNPFSGEGLLQTNEVPPIAKDIENFNNYTFYSNTKTFHRSQFRFVSVDDFKNQQTAIYIGNEDTLRQYIFEGTQQQTEIKCGNKADTSEPVIEENELEFKDTNVDYLVDTADFKDNSSNVNVISTVDIYENYVIESLFDNNLYFYKISNNELVLKNTLTLGGSEEIKLISIYGDYLVLLISDSSSEIIMSSVRLYKIEEDVLENITLQFLGSHSPPDNSQFNSLYIYDNKIVVNITSSLTLPTIPAILLYEIVNDQLNFIQNLNPTPATTANTIALYENTLIMAGTSTLLYDISDINNPTLIDQIFNSSDSIVAVHGNYVVISSTSSTGSDSSFSNAGEVIVYKIINNQLNKITTLYSPVEDDNSRFGRSLDIYNNYILIGSRDGDVSFPNEGGAFLFRINSDDSIELVNILTSNDESLSSDFGSSLGLYNSKIVIGSQGSLGTHLFEIQQTEYCLVESTKQSPAFLELYSREDVNKYHLWYDKGTGFDPADIEQEITGVSENSTDDKLEKNSHGLVDGDIIEYNNLEYFVVNSTVDDFQLSEIEGGNPIEIQSDNTVNIIKKEVSKESIGIKVDISTNNTRTEILQSTVTKLNEFPDFNTEVYNSVEGAFGKASTNTFSKLPDTISNVQENSTDNKLEKINHGLLNSDIVVYNSQEYFVINSSQNDFQISLTKSGNFESILADNLVSITKLNPHKLLQGNILSYTNPEGITKLGSVIIISNDEFQLSEVNVGSTIEIGTSLENVIQNPFDDKLEKNNHELNNGQSVEYNGTDYTVKNATTDTFQLEDNSNNIIQIDGTVLDIDSVDINTDTFEETNHGLVNDTKVRYINRSGKVIGDYFVINSNTDDFQISLSEGGVVAQIDQSLQVQENSSEDTLELNNHGLTNGERVIYEGVDYIIIEATTDSFKIHTAENQPPHNITTDELVTIETYDPTPIIYTINEINLSVNDLSVNLPISNPFIMSVKNSRAGDSTGIVSKNQDQIQINNVQNGKSAYINLYSAEDKLNYYIWFDKGSGTDPLIDSSVSIRVDISGSGIDPEENVGQYLEIALLDILDFNTIYNKVDTITITNINNGKTTSASTFNLDASLDIGKNWLVSTILEGKGEDSNSNKVLWSVSPSLGQSIEETARSFVKVVNRDINSPVNAFYLSGEEDIPGLILLESRNLEDKPFYIGVGNRGTIGKDISNEFDPALPFVNGKKGGEEESTIGSIVKLVGEDITRVNFDNHGLTVGDQIYFNVGPVNEQSNVNQISQVFTVISKVEEGIEPDDNFYIQYSEIVDTTNSPSFYFYKTDQASENEVKPNRIYYSKLLQPEAVPIGNFLDVGSRDFPIERILALRDTLFVLKTDGVYMLTGFGAPFAVRILDNTSKIIAPDSAVILNNQIYCLTDDGVASITESGISIISRPIEDKILDVTGQDFDFRLSTFAVPYDNDKAYILWLPVSSEDTVSKQAYRYNYYEKTWTRWTVSATSGVVSNDSILYLGDGERPYTLKERKSRSRLDFSDINFTLQIPPDSVIGETTIRLSNFSEVEIGDVLVQEQYVTIDVYNNLLLKLDLDPLVNKKQNIELSEDSTLVVDSLNNTILITEIEGDISVVDFSNKKIEFVEINNVNDSSTLYTIEIKEELSKTYNVFENRSEILLKYENISTNAINNLSLTNEEIGRVVYFNECYEAIKAVPGDNISTKLDQLEQKLISDGINVSDRTWIPSAQDLETSTFAEYIRDEFNAFIDELNNENSGTQYKTYSKANQLIQYESIVDSKNTTRPDLNRISVLIPHRFFEGDIEIYKAIKTEIQWNPLHFGDPSAQKQFSKGTVIVDQNNFTKATVSYSSDVSQGFVDIEKQGKGVGYFSSGNYGDSNLYWGGDGNDVPLLNIIPREKQRGRYLNVKFQHAVAREGFRVLGVTTVVRAVSDRGYR